VRAGELVTPPESLGILPGITRKVALQVAEELGLSVSLRALRVDELASVDELFVSSSIRELLPVVSVDGRPIASGVPGPITQRLLSAFRQHVRRR
jgi:branched-subunit amino acid aminotransferase/4-amino-4-deoxychorismate lyase